MDRPIQDVTSALVYRKARRRYCCWTVRFNPFTSYRVNHIPVTLVHPRWITSNRSYQLCDLCINLIDRRVITRDRICCWRIRLAVFKPVTDKTTCKL